MPQTSNTLYDEVMANPSVAVDYAFVIAGHPTIYTVNEDGYSIPATGDLSTAEGFTGIRQWLYVPKGAASSVKGRPEEGAASIGQIDVEILDMVESGVRALSDLVSRQYYLENTGAETTLNGDISASATTLVFTDATNLSEGQIVHIGQEAVLLGTKSSNTFTDCTRGYRLTPATPHLDGVSVYTFKPTLDRTMVYLFKGSRDLPLDKWLRAAGGVLAEEKKGKGKFHFVALGTTWETYAKGTKRLFNFDTEIDRKVINTLGIGPNDFQTSIGVRADDLSTAEVATRLGDGHWMIQISGVWYGITAAQAAGHWPDGSHNIFITIVKGIGAGAPTEWVNNVLWTDGQEGQLGWTNANFTSLPPGADPSTTEPIRLLLELLTSTGEGTNGSYDVLSKGIGLGIPADLIDTTSFTDIQAEYDYDENARLFFLIEEPEEAKKFIEEQLCRPFGWYLSVGNDGKIKLVRPKHPQKFYVSRANDTINVTVSGTVYGGTLAVGVYTAEEMATEIAAVLNGCTEGNRSASEWACSYNTSTHIFTITKTSTAWDLTASADDGWTALGFSAQAGIGSGVGKDSSAVGTWPGTGCFASALDKNDVWDVEQLDTRGWSITRVILEANYDTDAECYRFQKEWLDAEMANLGDVAGARVYIVKSKGLIGRGLTAYNPVWYWSAPPANSCEPLPSGPNGAYLLDATASWSELLKAHLFDRYKHPPIAIKGKLRWEFNTAEQGDCFKFGYDTDGVFVDRERDTSILSGRIFEILSIKPDFYRGHLEFTALGHRYVSY